MSEEFKLTLEPFEDEGKTEPTAEITTAEKAEPEVFDESTLTDEERNMIAEFADKIEIGNAGMILQYGAGAQKKIADFSENALNNVKTKDMGEIGEMLSDIVVELKEFDVEEQKGGFRLFKKLSNKVNTLKVKYDKAEANINQICEVLENHQVVLLKDIAMLDKMYEMNKSYFKELSMYIIAGKKKLNQVLQEDLPVLQKRAAETGLPEDAQAANDLASMCNRFEKKLYDLELTRTVSIQMAPQIRLIQNNDTLMTEKIQSTLVNTIPLWKSQMLLALGVAHSQQAVEAQRQISDKTNELLRKNAETLKMATVETAKEAERGVVDIETLRATNESLITTLDEVMNIQQEGRQRRQEAEAELQKIEEELKQKLLEIRK
ncbi:MAG: toxic anion resistance protein [Clostridiales bacterium]|nr:toxic anion resistance protein [Clostridiales bacterium]